MIQDSFLPSDTDERHGMTAMRNAFGELSPQLSGHSALFHTALPPIWGVSDSALPLVAHWLELGLTPEVANGFRGTKTQRNSSLPNLGSLSDPILGLNN